MSKQQRTRLALAMAVGSIAAFVLAVSIRMVWAQIGSSHLATAVDPYEQDLDGDGFSDGIEEEWSTDANDPESFVRLENELIVQLDGAQRGEVPNRDVAQPESRVSVAACVRLRANATGIIASQGTYSLGVQDGHPTFEVQIAGERWPLIAPISIPDDGEAHYLAGSFDGRALRLYLDGAVPIAIAHMSGPIDASEEALVLGDISGTVTDVRVYGRALSDGEVLLVGELAGTEEQ